MNVSRGGCVNPPSQRRISFESACADIDSTSATRAWTGNHLPVNLDRLLAVHELPAARALCLVAHEQHRVAESGSAAFR